MKKEELKAIFSDGKNIPDFGPIENFLHAVATERQLPDLAIGVCTVRIEESRPMLRAVLIKAADGEPLSDDEQMLLFRGLFILGGTRDSAACQPLLRLLRRPYDEVEYLLGDAVTEGLTNIVAGMFDGDVDALFGMITDCSIDEFVREALLGAATFLTWEGRIERDRMIRFLDRFYEERLAPDGDYTWAGWLEAIALLGLRDLSPLVHRAWDEDRVPEGILDRSDFEHDLAAAERAPDDVDRFKRPYHLGYIDDVLKALEWTRRLGYPDTDQVEEPPWTDTAFEPMTPVVNPWRHVRRNDPCPCGSGKKAKKCCLA